MHSIIRYFTIFLLCCIPIFHLQAQTPYLEKVVTIRSGNYSYEELFNQIANQTGVVFSHSNFDDKQRVSVRFDKQPLRIVLNTLFSNGNCNYKLKGKYVIVNCKSAPKASNTSSSSSNVVVNGYILNAKDSSQLVESSVYLRQNKQSALTNEYGYFKLSFPKTTDILSISVAKEHFKDTTVVIFTNKQNTLVIYLQPKSIPTSFTMDSVRITLSMDSITTTEVVAEESDSNGNSFWKRFREHRANLKNISDTLFTKVSFSLVPPISTNRLLSVNTVNKLSFNLLAGTSKGIDVFELGGLVNIDYGNVQYAQIGGLANLVSGTTQGAQIGGLVNAVAKDVSGVQIAGLVNSDGGKVKYVQIAGITNLVKDTVTAVQIGGIANLNNSCMQGIQIAGIYNHSRNVHGGQIAGLLNRGKVVNGAQVSGLINFAEKVNGIQIGVLNFADSVSGVPIGFFSFVKKGYHKIELAFDESLFGTLSFRTGVDAFHNIFIGGIQSKGSSSLWTLGYGVGSAIQLGKKLYLNLDLSSQQLFLGTDNFSYNMLTKSFVGIEYRFRKYFSIAAGPTLNWYHSDYHTSEFDPIWNRLNQHSIYSPTDSNFTNHLWIGGKVAIRFL